MYQTILIFAVIGFAAQLIDGALGMAYGVVSTTILLSIGLPPAVASASVHTSEIFTTAVSGISHFKFGNVDKSLTKKLIIPGVAGGVAGAYILSSIPGDTIKPFVSLYLITMGFLIIFKTVKKSQENEVKTKLALLGVIAGFFDAIGGGAGGP